MVNPQRENGYIEINNENADRFAKLHLSGNEWQVLWVVLRKTWGWNKKIDPISLSQFQELTGLSRPSVNEAVSKLVGKKVLFVDKQNYINKYSFNKLYNQWIVGKSLLVGKNIQDSREKPTRVVGKSLLKLVGKSLHTKDNKDNTIKEIINKIIE
jgi:phage replication O-like protein O